MSGERPLRIAFLTPEFVNGDYIPGGLAAYVYRISKALTEMGNEVEVFTLSASDHRKEEVFTFDGIRVEPVKRRYNLPLKVISRLRLNRYLRIRQTYLQLALSLGFAHSFEARESEKRFDFVQSSDVGCPGLFVRKLPGRPLMVRCSWVRDLWLRADGAPRIFDINCTSGLQKALIRRADRAYAPSRFVADYYFRKCGLRVETLRPPFLMDAEAAREVPWKLPKRFLFHFGTLGPIKGTDVLSAALPIVWRRAPDFTMIWAGKGRVWGARGQEDRPDVFREYSHAWGKQASQVLWLGEIRKPLLYAVLKRAESSVLPSRYDNLPNTAIESLFLGVPVIGTYGSSIDELVEPGLNGGLVPVGDPAALAEEMLKVWRGEVTWTGSGFRYPSVLNEMKPDVAASNLLRLAGFSDVRDGKVA